MHIGTQVVHKSQILEYGRMRHPRTGMAMAFLDWDFQASFNFKPISMICISVARFEQKAVDWKAIGSLAVVAPPIPLSNVSIFLLQLCFSGYVEFDPHHLLE
jgi:hypothetical protein